MPVEVASGEGIDRLRIQIPDDDLTEQRAITALTDAGYLIEPRPSRTGRELEATNATRVDTAPISIAVVHRDLLGAALRAQVAVRPEQAGFLPCLADLAQAGHQIGPCWHTAEAVGAVTDEEHRLLAGLAAGLTNQQMAQSAALSPRQVQRRLDHLYHRIGATGRRHATTLAARWTCLTH